MGQTAERLAGRYDYHDLSLHSLLDVIASSTRTKAQQVGPADAMTVTAYLTDGRVLSIGGIGEARTLSFVRAWGEVRGFAIHIYGDEPSYQEGQVEAVRETGPFVEELAAALRDLVGPDPQAFAGYLRLTNAEVDYLRMLVDCDEGASARTDLDTDHLATALGTLLQREQVAQEEEQ